MSMLNVRLMVRGEDHTQVENRQDALVKRAYDFKELYNIDYMNKIVLEPSEPWEIQLDVEKLGEEIAWAKQKYPTRKVKQAVLDIVALAPHWRAIRKKTDEIKALDFEERYRFERLTDDLIALVEQLPAAKSIPYFEEAKRRAKDYLTCTLHKEVKYAADASRKDTQKRKDQVIKEAKSALFADIKELGWSYNLVAE